MVLGVGDDQHLGQKHDAERPEAAGVHVSPKCVCGAVVLWGQEVVDVEYCNLSAATMLAKRRVVDGAMMIHHVDGAAVLAHDEIGRIAEQTPVQRIRRYFAATDDRLGCAVVRRIERGIERNDVQVRKSASRREDVPTLAHHLLRDVRRAEKGRHRECETSEGPWCGRHRWKRVEKHPGGAEHRGCRCKRCKAERGGWSHVSSAFRAIIGTSYVTRATANRRAALVAFAASSATPGTGRIQD